MGICTLSTLQPDSGFGLRAPTAASFLRRQWRTGWSTWGRTTPRSTRSLPSPDYRLDRVHRERSRVVAYGGQWGGLRGVVRQRYLLLTSSGERVRLRGFGNGRWQLVLLRPAAGERSGAGRTTTCPAGTGHAQT